MSETVTLVMTDKGMNSLLAPSFKLGPDVSVAAGPVGAGAKSNLAADLIAFSARKVSMAASTSTARSVNTSDDWNKAYYGKKVQSPDILIRQTVHNKGADSLLAQVTKAAGGK